jgi:hypothetical protein
MAWFDYLGGIGKGLESGVENLQRQRQLDAQEKRLLAEEKRNEMRAAREEETFQRDTVKDFLDNAPDDWNGNPFDDVVKLAAKHGMKNRFQMRSDGTMGLVDTPERKKARLQLEQIQLAHDNLVRTSTEEKARQIRADAVKDAIAKGTFYKIYPSIQARKAELTFAGLPDDLAYQNDDELKRELKWRTMLHPSVVSQQIDQAGRIQLQKDLIAAGGGTGRGGSRVDPSLPDIDQYTSAGTSTIRAILDTLSYEDKARYLADPDFAQQINKRAVSALAELQNGYKKSATRGTAPTAATPRTASGFAITGVSQ